MRVLVLGGTGNFGARICRDLSHIPSFEVIAGGRRSSPGTLAPVPFHVLDSSSPKFPAELEALRPDIVVHCAGPYQGQDYRVAHATLKCGAHYIDLADGRDFVAGFIAGNQLIASGAHRLAITGASTLPALSSAVVDSLGQSCHELDRIEIVIAPGQRAPRGIATMRAVFGYAGQDFRWWQGGAWRIACGWQELKRIELPYGTRLAAACDVPDLELFPKRYPGVQTVTFHAALEVPVLHYALWSIAGLRRLGLPLRVDRWAPALSRTAAILNLFGTDRGGMRVLVSARDATGRQRTITWNLEAGSNHGPEIPCMASTLMARKLSAGGHQIAAGAHVCMGMLTLAEFEREFARWDIRTSVKDDPQ